MTLTRPLALLCALVPLAACSLGEVELEGLECPCAAGWVCLEDRCVREEDAPDAAPAPDFGPADLGLDLAVDMGSDLGTDLGTDGGPDDLGLEGDGGPVEPVDCTPLMARENTEFCGATRETCSAEAQNMTTCDALCAAAGLVCLEAYDDLSMECGPDLTAPTTCDDATKMIYHCLCIRE